AGSTASNIDQDLCGCHMPAQFYTNYENSVLAQFPGFKAYFQNFGIPTACLLSDCANSDFPTVAMGKHCPVPGCLNVAVFDNNGSIGGNVTVNQNATCQSIQNFNGNTGGGNTGGNIVTQARTWIDKYWPWLLLGIGIFVIFILIILIIIASDSNKKKGKEYHPNTSLKRYNDYSDLNEFDNV